MKSGSSIIFEESHLIIFYIAVIIKNTGSTTVTYEWKKIERGDYIHSKHSDGI